MNNTAHSSHASVEQITNNATSWDWASSKRTTRKPAGDKHLSPTWGKIDAIVVYTNIVTKPGNVMMTIHSFYLGQKVWGPALQFCQC